MPAISTSTIALPSTDAAANVPVAAKPAKRIVRTAKPAAAKPATAAPAKPSADAVVYRSATRDAAGVVRAATNFDTESSRDEAYLRFFASAAKRGVATLADLHNAGVKRDGNAAKRYNPFYDGSAKATDVGALNRLAKAGYLTVTANGTTFTATKRATDAAAYKRGLSA